MSELNEFIDYGFEPKLTKHLRNNRGFLRYLDMAGVRMKAVPAPTLDGRRAALWYGEIASNKMEVPTLAVVTFDNTVGITDCGSSWFVGAPSLDMIARATESLADSVQPRRAALLTHTEHGPFATPYEAMTFLKVILPARDYVIPTPSPFITAAA
jgi:hypothetical protein